MTLVSETQAAIAAELAKARAKFPANRQLLHAFVEEAGEVTKAFLDMQQKGGSPEDVRKELIQAAAMAVRLLEEGDPEFPEYVPVRAVSEPVRTVSDMDRFYEKRDPWGYETCPADAYRKARILSVLADWVGWANRALDIACGEGWITKDISAKRVYGWDISETARSRFPENIHPLDPLDPVLSAPKIFDLVICTGALYESYDWRHLLVMIKRNAARWVLTCHIKHREVPDVMTIGQEIYSEEFEYKRPEENYVQKLRLFDVTL